MACLLKTRSVIHIRGPETIKFLQGLVTNDVRSLDNPKPMPENAITPKILVVETPAVYAAMLTPQGRFLFDFFLYRPPHLDEKLNHTGSGPGPESDEMEIYADVDKNEVDEILATLKRYRLRSKVDIENVSESFSCWQWFNGNLWKRLSSLEESEAGSVGWDGTIDHSGVLASGGNSLGWKWKRDPRLACLGYRGIFPSDETPPLVEANKETDDEKFLLWRLEKGIPEGSTEIPKGEAIPLEYNLAGLNAISFDKGCYIGQELIARTHHRGIIRKRLIPLRFLNQNRKDIEQKVIPNNEVIDIISQKKAGVVTTAVGSHGLGLLRVDKAFRQSGSLTIKGQEDVNVETVRPKWWPSEWLLDHQHRSDST